MSMSSPKTPQYPVLCDSWCLCPDHQWSFRGSVLTIRHIGRRSRRSPTVRHMNVRDESGPIPGSDKEVGKWQWHWILLWRWLWSLEVCCGHKRSSTLQWWDLKQIYTHTYAHSYAPSTTNLHIFTECRDVNMTLNRPLYGYPSQDDSPHPKFSGHSQMTPILVPIPAYTGWLWHFDCWNHYYDNCYGVCKRILIIPCCNDIVDNHWGFI